MLCWSLLSSVQHWSQKTDFPTGTIQCILGISCVVILFQLISILQNVSFTWKTTRKHQTFTFCLSLPVFIFQSYLGTKVRRQCFSSSETLDKKSFPVRVLMLYACKDKAWRRSASRPGHSDTTLPFSRTYFLEVQGVCRLKHTSRQGAPQGYIDCTRSLCWCHCQSLHTSGEPWTLPGRKKQISVPKVTNKMTLFFVGRCFSLRVAQASRVPQELKIEVARDKSRRWLTTKKYYSKSRMFD